MVLSSDPILIVACGGAGARSLPQFDVFFFFCGFFALGDRGIRSSDYIIFIFLLSAFSRQSSHRSASALPLKKKEKREKKENTSRSCAASGGMQIKNNNKKTLCH